MNSDHSAHPFSFTFKGKVYPVSPIKGSVEAEYERQSFQDAKDALRAAQDILAPEDYAAEGKKLYEAYRRGEHSLEYAMADAQKVKTLGLTLLAICFGMGRGQFKSLWQEAYGELMDLFFELCEHAYPAAAPVLAAKKKQLPALKAQVAAKLAALISTACAVESEPPAGISSASSS